MNEILLCLGIGAVIGLCCGLSILGISGYLEDFINKKGKRK